MTPIFSFNALKLEKHPDKTFIGKIDKGFDFLGYHFSPAGLTVATETLRKFVERATRLYAQERGKPEGQWHSLFLYQDSILSNQQRNSLI